MRTLILFIFSLSSFLGLGQNAFYKLYSNNGYDSGEGIAQLEDSSFIVTGTSSSFLDGPSQAFLLKVDSLGVYQWSLPFGGLEEDGAKRVLYSSGDGYYVSGYTNSSGSGGYDVYTFKTDLSGTLIWEKSFGGLGWEKTNDALLLKDTSQIIVGQTNSNTNGDEDIYILRLDKNGDSLYSKQIGESGDDIATTIDLLNDSTVIIGGTYYNTDSLKSKGYLMGMHINGTVLWSQEYGPDGNYWFNDLTIQDSLIHVVGKYYNDTVLDYEGYSGIMKHDGTLTTEFVFYKEGYDSHEFIVKYGSGDKFYIGFNVENTGSYPGGVDFIIMRNKSNLLFDNSGCNFANVGDELGGQLIPTNDGGAILVGTNEAYNIGGTNVALLKIGKNDAYPYTSGYMIPNHLVQVLELAKKTSALSIFPNPSTGSFQIKSEEFKVQKIKLFGIDGQLFFQKQLVEMNDFVIELPKLQSGNYLMELENEQGMKITKVFILTTDFK